MKYNIRAEELNIDDNSLIAVLRLLCSLEYSNATMIWYAGPIAGRPDLPPHESILALALNIASTAEALHKFHELTRENIIKMSDNWDQSAKKSFEFLQSAEVNEFKQKHLKLIRDKSVFHIDPHPVKNFIEKRLNSENVLCIWETDKNGKKGHSPMAAEIVGEYIMDATFNYEESAKIASSIFGAIRSVVLEYIVQNIKVIPEDITDKKCTLLYEGKPK